MQTVEGTVNTFAVVRSILREEGLDLSPEGEAFIANSMTNKIRIGGGKAVLIAEREATGELDLFAHLRVLRQSEATQRYFMASRSDARVQPVNVPARNPWSKEDRNLTQQMLLENTQPELAKRLKAEAKQNGAGDPSNPFSLAGWNLTKQMQMQRADPELAAHMEANANV
ncbi:hypothetical protein [Bradyrhizobium sp. G127]|uniref:hypothetical protein n=1 Tax=Bradyrhizobium sp. G127 TaxID=2904800 RepID=UPI001F363702|nr:hypothetical protein [Bradyrhizobium sp. G127]MCF2522394.1 hypothetical protein [Bradyrhizobium sp. G127]